MRKKVKKGVSKIDRSQTFSLDILIALGIFIAGILVFLFLIGGSTDKDMSNKLVSDAEIVPQRLIASDEYSATNTTFVIGNRVDSELLNKTLSMDYSELKRELEVVSDFCVHFVDDNGKLIDLNEDPCLVQYSMGDSRLILTILDQNGNARTLECGAVESIC